MSSQLGITRANPRAQASFLQGGIAAQYLPSADVTPVMVRRATYVRASGTQGVDCSINQHIPACRVPTSDCTVACPDPGTGSFCPTREFVQTCGGCR
jgi:hypothetical protein